MNLEDILKQMEQRKIRTKNTVIKLNSLLDNIILLQKFRFPATGSKMEYIV